MIGVVGIRDTRPISTLRGNSFITQKRQVGKIGEVCRVGVLPPGVSIIVVGLVSRIPFRNGQVDSQGLL